MYARRTGKARALITQPSAFKARREIGILRILRTFVRVFTQLVELPNPFDRLGRAWILACPRHAVFLCSLRSEKCVASKFPAASPPATNEEEYTCCAVSSIGLSTIRSSDVYKEGPVCDEDGVISMCAYSLKILVCQTNCCARACRREKVLKL